jgi:hypothetical protein
MPSGISVGILPRHCHDRRADHGTDRQNHSAPPLRQMRYRDEAFERPSGLLGGARDPDFPLLRL